MAKKPVWTHEDEIDFNGIYLCPMVRKDSKYPDEVVELTEVKIERYFGNKQSEDTVCVTEVSTGKTFSTLDLGKKFFQKQIAEKDHSDGSCCFHVDGNALRLWF